MTIDLDHHAYRALGLGMVAIGRTEGVTMLPKRSTMRLVSCPLRWRAARGDLRTGPPGGGKTDANQNARGLGRLQV
jgi:hypothetical protein